MTPIRPNAAPLLPQGLSPTGPSQDAGKLAAQKAFFAMVSGQGQAAPAAAAQPAALQTVAAQAAQPIIRAGVAPPEVPQKIPRPGSLLDIRV